MREKNWAKIKELRERLDRLLHRHQRFNQARRAADAAESHRIFHEVLALCDECPSEPTLQRLYATSLTLFHNATKAAYPPGFWEAYQQLRVGNPAGLETAVAFLEADPWFFRSGYIKGYLIRYINRLPLSQDHVRRLRGVVLTAIDGRDRREFRCYCRLARKVYGAEWRPELLGRLEDRDPDIRRRARWVLDACGRPG